MRLKRLQVRNRFLKPLAHLFERDRLSSVTAVPAGEIKVTAKRRSLCVGRFVQLLSVCDMGNLSLSLLRRTLTADYFDYVILNRLSALRLA